MKKVWIVGMISLFGMILMQPVSVKAMDGISLTETENTTATVNQEELLDAPEKTDSTEQTKEIEETTDTTTTNTDSTKEDELTTKAETTDTTEAIAETTTEEQTATTDSTENSETKESSDNQEGLNENATPAEIRKFLEQSSDYITKEELATFTDTQLGNTWQAFKKYNSDVTGMDLSSYVRLLREIYVEKSLSFDAMSQQMSFELSCYVRASDIIPHLAEFKAYINAFYPPTSGFLPLRELSDKELTDILNYLVYFELQVGNHDGFGRMFTINRVARDGIPAEYWEAMKNGEKTQDSQKEQVVPVANPTNNNTAGKSNTKLPQMSEETDRLSLFAGLILLAGALVVFYFKGRKLKTLD